MDEMSVGNVQAVHGDGRQQRDNQMSAAEAIHTKIDVVRCFLTVMAGMATSAIVGSPGRTAPAQVEIEANALEVVLFDLARRCEEAGEAVLELGYGRAG